MWRTLITIGFISSLIVSIGLFIGHQYYEQLTWWFYASLVVLFWLGLAWLGLLFERIVYKA